MLPYWEYVLLNETINSINTKKRNRLLDFILILKDNNVKKETLVFNK